VESIEHLVDLPIYVLHYLLDIFYDIPIITFDEMDVTMATRPMRNAPGGTAPYQAMPYRLYLADYAPEGLDHVSPELRQARLRGVPAFREATPVRITRHAHPGFEVDLVMHGTGRMIIDAGETVELSPGHVLYLPIACRHALEIDDHLCVFGIEVSPTAVHQPLMGNQTSDLTISNALAHRSVRLLHDPLFFHSLEHLLDECAAEYAQSAPYHTQIADALSRLVALSVLRMLQQEHMSLTMSPTEQRVLAVKARLDRHLFEPITLTEMAEQAALSISQFSAIFRRLAGCSPKAYIITRCLQHAARLLVETGHSVTDVALSVGYRDLANFHHAFRRYSGISPLSYRKKYQKVD